EFRVAVEATWAVARCATRGRDDRLHRGPGPGTESQARDVQEAARTLGLQMHVLNAGTEVEINTAFADFAKLRVGALVVGGGTLFPARAQQFATLAAHHALPTFYQYREYVAAGGLISYGTGLSDSYRQTGVLYWPNPQG